MSSCCYPEIQTAENVAATRTEVHAASTPRTSPARNVWICSGWLLGVFCRCVSPFSNYGFSVLSLLWVVARWGKEYKKASLVCIGAQDEAHKHLSTMASSSTMSTGLRNPILPGFNPDPSLIRVGEDYFLCTSTFEYFPGLPIYHSTDLVNWKLIGHVLTRRSQLDLRECKPGGGIFAPTIRYHNGRFYATVSVTHRGGEYKDPEVSRSPSRRIWDEAD